MHKKIDSIEGIGPSYARQLRAAGIETTAQLLQSGATRTGRTQLSSTTGINEKLILKWVNMADLFRIKGIATQYAELLEAAGVDTVTELRNRNTRSLAQQLQQVNDARHLVRQTPGENLVAEWIDQAKGMDAIVTH